MDITVKTDNPIPVVKLPDLSFRVINRIFKETIFRFEMAFREINNITELEADIFGRPPKNILNGYNYRVINKVSYETLVPNIKKELEEDGEIDNINIEIRALSTRFGSYTCSFYTNSNYSITVQEISITELSKAIARSKVQNLEVLAESHKEIVKTLIISFHSRLIDQAKTIEAEIISRKEKIKRLEKFAKDEVETYIKIRETFKKTFIDKLEEIRNEKIIKVRSNPEGFGPTSIF